jgi:hypothetical protein
VALAGAVPGAVAVAVPPSVAAECAVDTPPTEVPNAEDVASVPPVVLDADAVASPPPGVLAEAADVPGPAVPAFPKLEPTIPDVVELEPALVSLDPLCALAAVPADVPLDSAEDVPPPVVFAPLSLDAPPASLCAPAPLPPSLACAEELWPSASAFDSAFEPLPTDPAPAPAPPPSGPDLPAPAVAVLLLPPYALAPAPVAPSPSLTPAEAGAPPVLLPYAPPMPTAPWS